MGVRRPKATPHPLPNRSHPLRQRPQHGFSSKQASHQLTGLLSNPATAGVVITQGGDVPGQGGAIGRDDVLSLDEMSVPDLQPAWLKPKRHRTDTARPEIPIPGRCVAIDVDQDAMRIHRGRGGGSRHQARLGALPSKRR